MKVIKPAFVNPSPLFSKVRQIAITVSDVARAKRFYQDILGLKFLFDAGPNIAFLECGQLRLMLSTPQGAGEAGKNSTLYFQTERVEAVYETVIAAGAKPERAPQLTAKMPDHELWIGFVRDPDGNLVGLLEEKR